MAILRARHHRDSLSGDVVGHGDAVAHGRGVYGDGLLREDVLAGRDRRLDVRRPEAWRRGEDGVVDVGLQELLVGVQAHEAVIVGDLGGIAVLLDERGPRGVEAVLERVGHRDNADAGGRLEGVPRRAGAAASAAHEADSNLVAASCIGTRQAIEARHDGARHGGAGGVTDEVAPRDPRG